MRYQITLICIFLFLMANLHGQSQLEVEAPTSDVLSLNSTESDATTINFLNANAAPTGGSDKRAYISTNVNVLNLGLSNNNTGGRIEFFGQGQRRMTMNADGRFGIGISPMNLSKFQIQHDDQVLWLNRIGTSTGATMIVENEVTGSSDRQGININVQNGTGGKIGVNSFVSGTGPYVRAIQGQAPDEGHAGYFIGRVETTQSMKIADHLSGVTPDPGTIRWSGDDFEGWNGIIWVSLTGGKKVGSVTDIDGNVYKTIMINDKEWMAENLKVTRYNNGIPITEVTDNTAWSAAGAAWCYYNNDSSMDDIYGKLYNSIAIHPTASKPICPTGWRIPSRTEIDDLAASLGDNPNGKLRAAGILEDGTGLWSSPNLCATNECGFSGLPGGFRSAGGIFSNINEEGAWWTSNGSTVLVLGYNKKNISPTSFDPRSGSSIRCIKD